MTPPNGTINPLNPVKHADSIDMDRLSPLFSRFAPSARVFYAGNLCHVAQYDDKAWEGAVNRGSKITYRLMLRKLVKMEQWSFNMDVFFAG